MKDDTAVELKRGLGWQLGTVKERTDGNIDVVNATGNVLIANASSSFVSMLLESGRLRVSRHGHGLQALYDDLFGDGCLTRSMTG